MPFQIIRNNIVNVSADAIVNTANPAVTVGDGVDHAIYRAAGWEDLLEARRRIGCMEPGEVAYTPAFKLNAKYIIHSIGPVWRGGDYGEREIVASCYRKSMELAAELECGSIAFPLLAAGSYGFPKDEALRIAIREISSFLLDHDIEVILVVYNKEAFELSGKFFSDVKTYIDDSQVVSRPHRRRRNIHQFFEGLKRESRQKEGAIESSKASADADHNASILYETTDLDSFAKEEKTEDITTEAEAEEISSEEKHLEESPSYYGGLGVDLSDTLEVYEPAALQQLPSYAAFGPSDSLDDRIRHMDKTFQQYLFMLIDRRGLTDPEVYKRANIDRKLFSKIRSDINYKPSKRTAVALAVALELNPDEMCDLLTRAGIALSPSDVFDVIIKFCFENRMYDIYEINCILFEYEQPLLGA